MVPYFEGGHFLTPFALGMVPFLVIYIFCKKNGSKSGIYWGVGPGPGRFENYFYCRPRVLLSVNCNLRLQILEFITL